MGRRGYFPGLDSLTMFGPFFLPHIPYEKYKALPRKGHTLGCDWGLYFLIHKCEEAMNWCPRMCGAGTGMKNNPGGEALIRHLCQGYIPERCAKRVKILTKSIVKLDAYPVAHGGFSDVWICHLRQKQNRSKRVRSPGLKLTQ